MTATQVIDEIKKGNVKPVYFLYGDEPYFIDLISGYIQEHLLDESEKGFDQTILYGRDTSVEDIIAAARRYPMMASRQVIIVKEAQELARHIGKLEAYVKDPQPSTVLVINYKYKTPGKHRKLVDAIKKTGILFRSDPVRDYQIPGWIKTYVKDQGYSIDDKSAILLSEYIGSDLSRIVNELNKLKLVLKEGEAITPGLIEKHIGISKDYNNFELQNALVNKNAAKAFRIVRYFASNPKSYSVVFIVYSLFNYYSLLLKYHGLPVKSSPQKIAAALKISPYYAKALGVAAAKISMRETARNISILREYDLKSKGVDSRNLSARDLLTEMVFRLIH